MVKEMSEIKIDVPYPELAFANVLQIIYGKRFVDIPVDALNDFYNGSSRASFYDGTTMIIKNEKRLTVSFDGPEEKARELLEYEKRLTQSSAMSIR